MISNEVDMKKKIKVRVTLTSFSPWDLGGSLLRVIKLFQEAHEAYSPEYTNLQVDLELHDSYGDTYNEFVIYGEREETNKEYEKRRKAEEKHKKLSKIKKEKKEEEERKQYESLKKKYE